MFVKMNNDTPYTKNYRYNSFDYIVRINKWSVSCGDITRNSNRGTKQKLRHHLWD